MERTERHPGSLALWQTVSAFGDKYTTRAMVGGIVALRTGIEGISANSARDAVTHD